MNKINLYTTIIVLLLFASCKKHHSCECISSGEIVGTPYTDSISKTTPKLSKEDAQTWCEEDNDTVADGYNTNYTTKCNLK